MGPGGLAMLASTSTMSSFSEQSLSQRVGRLRRVCSSGMCHSEAAFKTSEAERDRAEAHCDGLRGMSFNMGQFGVLVVILMIIWCCYSRGVVEGDCSQ